MKVWILLSGDGMDGDEYSLLGIYSSLEAADAAKDIYQQPIYRPDGSTYSLSCNDPEEVTVDAPADRIF
jgi:hypothetical protein